MQNVGRAAMRSLQRVVHRLRGYVRGFERCVRLQAIAKNAVCVFYLGSCLVSYIPLANETHQSNEGGISCKSRSLREGLRI